uniref:Putative secreted protein n=1 Tax=Anopheles marajoara TaxID=58244 RepID=A0A2M4CGP6_9DIPT
MQRSRLLLVAPPLPSIKPLCAHCPCGYASGCVAFRSRYGFLLPLLPYHLFATLRQTTTGACELLMD